MIPMGSVVTVCMLAGVVGGVLTPAREPDSPQPPVFAQLVSKSIGFVVLAAGVWNIAWYWVRHPVSYWGLAALVSGLLMLWVSVYLLASQKVSPTVRRLKPVALVLLTLAFLHYAITIYRL